ncbi:unnamed protein product [Rotaria socialis]|uniref:Uncharacterized protein n=1 Tax=Rotaria socialis TaxID=392032 RepID=A0A820MZZ1_9BILA|nr:unnamed protein product [Rotaria socialis]CAF5001214.1 unnamed protein product [Rotaria socialis]
MNALAKRFLAFLGNRMALSICHFSSFGIKEYKIIRAVHDETNTRRYKRSILKNNPHRILTLELDDKNITLILKSINEFFANNADIHLGASTFLPINSSILYEGYVLGNNLRHILIE